MLSSIQFMLYEEFVGENRLTRRIHISRLFGSHVRWILTNPLNVIGTRIMVQGQGECLSSSGKETFWAIVLAFKNCTKLKE